MAVNKEPINVDEDIELLMKVGDKKDIKVMIEELQKSYDKNCHKNYDSFSVCLVTRENKTGLLLAGVRKENKEETAKRVKIEEDKEKRNADAELKQYLALKKKYAKD